MSKTDGGRGKGMTWRRKGEGWGGDKNPEKCLEQFMDGPVGEFIECA